MERRATRASSVGSATEPTDTDASMSMARADPDTSAVSLLRCVTERGGARPEKMRSASRLSGGAADDRGDRTADTTHSDYIVLSDAGKLVYASGAGHDDGWTFSQAGVMHALLSLFSSSGDGSLQQIVVEQPPQRRTRISFVTIAPLHYVCCSGVDEPREGVREALLQLCAAVTSLVSARKLRMLYAKMPNFDLRALISETSSYLDGVVADMGATLTLPLHALQVYPIEAALRARIAAATVPPKRIGKIERPNDLFFVLMLRGSHLVSIAHARRVALDVRDIALVIAMVQHGPAHAATASGRDSWVPICLPRLSPDGFVFVYASRLHPAGHDSGSCATLVMVCGDRDGYAAAQACRRRLEQECDEGSDFAQLASGAAAREYTPDELGITGLRDFVLASRRHNQYTTPRADDTDAIGTQWRARLRIPYVRMLSTLRQGAHASAQASALAPYVAAAKRDGGALRLPPIRAPLRLMYMRTSEDVLLAWRTHAFDVCIAVHPPWLSKAAIVAAGNRVMQWARREERTLFASAYVF